jgi:dihydroxyacetone kinase-like protein
VGRAGAHAGADLVAAMTGTLDAAATRAWIERFAAAFSEHREHLDDLDRQSGDADFGTNLESAMRRVTDGLAGAAADTPGAVLGVVATAFMHTGGTSGPLFGMWFMQLARAAGAAPAIGLAELAAGVSAGLAGIQKLGKAEPGDKTMVDALLPAVAALREAQSAGVAEAVDRAASAAEEGMKATIPMEARKGRASYLGPRSVDHQDPGATSSYLLLRSAAETFAGS